MIRRINSRSARILSLLFLISIAYQACDTPSKREYRRPDSDNKVLISVKYFKSDTSDSRGYEIIIDKKVYIHQEFIPALEGNQPFKSKRDALKVGRAVMQKIKNKKSPSLSKKEVLEILDLKE